MPPARQLALLVMVLAMAVVAAVGAFDIDTTDSPRETTGAESERALVPQTDSHRTTDDESEPSGLPLSSCDGNVTNVTTAGYRCDGVFHTWESGGCWTPPLVSPPGRCA